MKSNIKNIHRLVSNARQPSPIGEDFVAELERVIEKKDQENKRKPTKSYKPSSMKCIRNMYFQLTGAEQDENNMDSNIIGICETGTDRHDRLQGSISEMYNYIDKFSWWEVDKYIENNKLDHLEVIEKIGHETKLRNNDLNMRFMCDGIITYKGETYILEIKTETTYKWQNRTGVAPEHIPQGTAYATNFNLDKVMFLYENRDFNGKKAYVLEVTEEMKDKYVRNPIRECDKYVEKQEVPPYPIQAKTNKKFCQYCPYITECKKAGR